MLNLAAADTIAGVASAASQVTCTIFGMELSGSTETYKVLYQGQLAAAAATIYTVPASTTAFVKSIAVVNNDASTRTFTLYRGGTANANKIIGPISLPAGYSAWFTSEGWHVLTDQGQVLGVGATGATGSTGSTGSQGPQGNAGPAPAGQLYLSAAGMWPSVTSGCAAATLIEMSTNKQAVYVLDFDPASVEYAQCQVAMPSDWNAGTITANFYWAVNASVTTVARWGIQGASLADNEAIDVAWGTGVSVDDTAQSGAHELYKSAATGAVTIAGAGASELVMFRIYREANHANDTMTQDARLIGVMINFTRS